jgi:hypothetical protein
MGRFQPIPCEKGPTAVTGQRINIALWAIVYLLAQRGIFSSSNGRISIALHICCRPEVPNSGGVHRGPCVLKKHDW